jgi:diguanylate cyclase (GGDEF)-like protein
MRAPWLLVGAGQLAFFAGDVLFDVFEQVLHISPFPSAPDALYVGAYALIAAALVLLARRHGARKDLASLIDAAIVTVGTGVLSWVFLIVPYATNGRLGVLERVFSIIYPLGDLLLLGLLARWWFATGGRSRGQRLFALGLVGHLLADTGYAWAVLRNLITSTNWVLDLGWLCGYALLAAAALAPDALPAYQNPVEVAPTLSVRRLVVFASAAVIAPSIILGESLAHVPASSVVAPLSSIVLVLLVLLRMSGLVRQLESYAARVAATADIDGLTGLLNRRAWDRELSVRLSTTDRPSARTFVGLLDLDQFKSYNDTRGHLAGDALLRDSARLWQTQLRPGDVLARYGGEEFAVLLPNTTLADAVQALERLRGATPDGQSCSAGLAEWDGAESTDSVLRRADAALYRAKALGRNRSDTDLVGGVSTVGAVGAVPHPVLRHTPTRRSEPERV